MPSRRLVVLLASILLPAAARAQVPLPGQIVVDPEYPARLAYHVPGGEPEPACYVGPGDPEDFFYNDPAGNLQLLLDRGARSTYITAVLKDFGGGSPGAGDALQQTIAQWGPWVDQLQAAGIVTLFVLFDDDHALPANWEEIVDACVAAFHHHPRLIWMVAEEYQEALSPTEVSAVAARIRAQDPHDHLIAVHQLSSSQFHFLDDPNVDLFAMQMNVGTPEALHDALLASNAAGKKPIALAEVKDHAKLDRETVRRLNWAAVLGGASAVQVLWMGRASDPADWNEPAKYGDAARLMDFVESVDLNRLRPNDALAFGATRWVSADEGRSYLAYASDANGDPGLRGMSAGAYDLRWLDIPSGAEVLEPGVVVSAGDRVFPRPAGIGDELALWVTRSGYGEPCPGAGGALPWLWIDGSTDPGSSFTLRMEGGAGGGSAFVAAGSSPGSTPLPGGCTLLVDGLVPAVLGPIALGGSGAGAGSFALGGQIPLGAPPASVWAQAFVVDPGAAAGLAATNGVVLTIP